VTQLVTFSHTKCSRKFVGFYPRPHYGSL